MCLILKDRMTAIEKARYSSAFHKEYSAIEIAKTKVLVAEQDIKCYKVLKKSRTGYKSMYQDFFYKLGFQYYQTGEFQEKFGIRIYLYDVDICINRGLHSYKTLKVARASCGYRLVIVECTIPKGSQYFAGKDNDYASDNIILNKEVK